MSGTLDTKLLNDFQRDFPLCESPFAVLAERLGCSEASVLQHLSRLQEEGKISRIGPVFSPGRVGASTLVAMAVPTARLGKVAAQVSAFPGVNHNYEREHGFNLWFVLTAPDELALQETLATIRQATGLDLLPLPLLEAFHIDLGFCLHGQRDVPQRGRPALPPLAEPLILSDLQRQLIARLQAGIPLDPHPYHAIARSLQPLEMCCSEILQQVQDWVSQGVIKRFGVVVRHHELGFSANAMLVHDIPDGQVSEMGKALASERAVTLCYRRPRALPDWPYNLFCMIHGRERGEVEAVIRRLRATHGLAAFPHEILFSKTRYKQVGARYA